MLLFTLGEFLETPHETAHNETARPLPNLTTRDREILEVLTLRVKLLTVSQIARTWWSGPNAEKTAARRVRDLEAVGMLKRFTVYAHPELPLTAPVFSWRPGDDAPSFGALSYRLTSRWTEAHRPTSAVIATQAAANSFGGHAPKPPKRVEENHDVHQAAVFLAVRAPWPELVKSWRAEPAIRRSRPDGPGEKLPDALLTANGAEKIIDFGGAYSAEKLEGFHAWAEQKGTPYELW